MSKGTWDGGSRQVSQSEMRATECCWCCKRANCALIKAVNQKSLTQWLWIAFTNHLSSDLCVEVNTYVWCRQSVGQWRSEAMHHQCTSKLLGDNSSRLASSEDHLLEEEKKKGKIFEELPENKCIGRRMKRHTGKWPSQKVQQNSTSLTFLSKRPLTSPVKFSDTLHKQVGVKLRLKFKRKEKKEWHKWIGELQIEWVCYHRQVFARSPVTVFGK